LFPFTLSSPLWEKVRGKGGIVSEIIMLVTISIILAADLVAKSETSEFDDS
jgi:hypothetical protein